MNIATPIAARERVIRTGQFQFVKWPDVDAFHSRGWMIVGDLGPVHGSWSALMWHCGLPECEA